MQVHLKTGKKPPGKTTTEKRVKQHSSKASGQSSALHSKRDNKYNQNTNVKCYRCGKPHLASNRTLSRDIRYHSCGKQGQSLRTVCFGNSSSANQLREILKLEHENYKDNFMLALNVNGKNVVFKIDNGAAVTVMNK